MNSESVIRASLGDSRLGEDLNCEFTWEKRLNSLKLDYCTRIKSHKVVKDKSKVCVEKLIDWTLTFPSGGHVERNFDTEVRCCGLHDHLGWSVTAKSAMYILGQVRRQRTSVTSVIIEWKPAGVWSRLSVSFCSAINLLATPLAKPLETIKLL